MMTCPQCSANLMHSPKFCCFCGQKLPREPLSLVFEEKVKEVEVEILLGQELEVDTPPQTCTELYHLEMAIGEATFQRLEKASRYPINSRFHTQFCNVCGEKLPDGNSDEVLERYLTLLRQVKRETP